MLCRSYRQSGCLGPHSVQRALGLDFYDDDRVSLESDYVELTHPHPPVAIQDLPAAALEFGRAEVLGFSA